MKSRTEEKKGSIFEPQQMSHIIRHKTTNTPNQSTLRISTWKHHRGNHTSGARFGVRAVLDDTWELFVLFGEALVHMDLTCPY